MLKIIENSNYSINLLDNDSVVSLVMVLVNRNTGGLVFKTDFYGVLSDFTNKYGDLIESYTDYEVFLDLFVIENNQKTHYATISSENELARQFEKYDDDEYSYTYATKDSDVLEIILISEDVMKGLISAQWDSYTLSYEDLQINISKLEALVNLNEQKLNSYKKVSSTVAVRGTDIEKLGKTLIEEANFEKAMQGIYSMMLIYDDLSSKITLSTVDSRKYSAVKALVRNGSALVKLINGKGKGFPFIKE
jgi:hypothetical protein